MKRIGIFCSSHAGLPASYVDAAQRLGQWIGTTGRMLVYGGVNKGLMEHVARAVKNSGGRTMGIIPEDMIRQNLMSDFVDVEIPCVRLSDRKEVMMREADAFVALPGGIGTLDELFSVAAAAQAGEHRKPLFLLNIDGVWNPLEQLITSLEAARLIADNQKEQFHFVKSVEDLIRELQTEA